MTDKIKLIENVFEKTKLLCTTNEMFRDLLLCNNTIGILEKTIPELRMEEENLKDMIGHERTKRGLFNIVGSVIKTITGNLDSSDAKTYDEAIEKVEKDEKETAKLLRDQIQVVKTTITNFNETITNLRKTENTFNKNIEILENYTKNTDKFEYSLKMSLDIHKHLSFLELNCERLTTELNSLTYAISLAQANILSDKIITPDQLIKELRKTQNDIPQGVNYPYPLEKQYGYAFFKILTLNVYFYNNKLVFVIKNPLVLETEFNLYKLLPLPVPDNNNNYFFIQPSIKYIALSHSRTQFTNIHNIKDCKLTILNTYICQTYEPIYMTYNEQNICEIKLLLTVGKIPKECDIRVIKLKQQIWNKLENKNEWLYVLPEPTHITITCKIDKPYDLILNNSGIITLNNSCKAYTPTAILRTHNTFQSNYTAYIPPIQLQNDDCCINKTFKIPILQKLKFPHTNIADLDVASHRLDEIAKLTEDLINDNHKDNINYYTSYIKYSLLTILTVYLLLKLYKKLRNIKLKRMKALEQRIHMNIRQITYNTRDDRIDQLSTNSESSTENDNIQCEYVTRH